MVISENCCNFIVSKYKVLQTIIAMFTEGKVTEIFYLADDFCKFFDAEQEKSMLSASQDGKKHRCKPNRMSDAEIIVILIHFHSGGFRCFKHYYLQYICKHCKHLFPNTFSYNRFVELEKEDLLQLVVFIVNNNMKVSSRKRCVQKITVITVYISYMIPTPPSLRATS